jgi:hypothetical protein
MFPQLRTQIRCPMISVQSQQRILTIRSGASPTDPPLIGGIGLGRSESPKPEWKQAQKPSAPSATLTPWRIRTLRGVSVSRSHRNGGLRYRLGVVLLPKTINLSQASADRRQANGLNHCSHIASAIAGLSKIRCFYSNRETFHTQLKASTLTISLGRC